MQAMLFNLQKCSNKSMSRQSKIFSYVTVSRWSISFTIFAFFVFGGFLIAPSGADAAINSTAECLADSNNVCKYDGAFPVPSSDYNIVGLCDKHGADQSDDRCFQKKPDCAAPSSCKTTCDSATEDVDTSHVCSGSQFCCKPKAAQTSCTAPSSCKTACDSATEDPDTGKTCSGSQVCCKPKTVGGGPQSISFANPLAYDTVDDVLGGLLNALQGIIVTLSIIFIVIGAVLYIISAGDSKKIETAKAAITAAMIGLALGIAAPAFLKEISTILNWTAPSYPTYGTQLSLSEILINVLNFLLGVVGILSIIILVIGALMYLTAAGDENRIEDGKKAVTYSVIGITLALAAMVIVRQIAAFFG